MTPEGRVKARVKALFQEFNDWYDLPVSNGMGKRTLDFYACHRGHFIAVETKAPGKKLTQLQAITKKKMEAAGAFVFVVSNDDELLVLRCYLELLT